MNSPEVIRRANQHDIQMVWRDGVQAVFVARDLRLVCPCAMCVSEVTGERLLKPDAVPADVHPLKIHPVGRYAIRIDWSDGHNTGIYSFESLRALALRMPRP